jgi:hypothetical protein
MERHVDAKERGRERDIDNNKTHHTQRCLITNREIERQTDSTHMIQVKRHRRIVSRYEQVVKVKNTNVDGKPIQTETGEKQTEIERQFDDKYTYKWQYKTETDK